MLAAKRRPHCGPSPTGKDVRPKELLVSHSCSLLRRGAWAMSTVAVALVKFSNDGWTVARMWCVRACVRTPQFRSFDIPNHTLGRTFLLFLFFIPFFASLVASGLLRCSNVAGIQRLRSSLSHRCPGELLYDRPPHWLLQTQTIVKKIVSFVIYLLRSRFQFSTKPQFTIAVHMVRKHTGDSSNATQERPSVSRVTTTITSPCAHALLFADIRPFTPLVLQVL